MVSDCKLPVVQEPQATFRKILVWEARSYKANNSSWKNFNKKEYFFKLIQKNNLPPQRKANEAIVEHEKKR